jgi:hypothetical protein
MNNKISGLQELEEMFQSSLLLKKADQNKIESGKNAPSVFLLVLYIF